MNWKKVTMMAGLGLASTSLMAADFTVRITSFPRSVPQGASIEVTVKVCNVSGHPITVAKGWGGFEYKLFIQREDGKARKGCKAPETASIIPGFTREVLPANWRQVRTENITCDDDPGVWLVQARISCQGTYPVYQSGQQTGQLDAWNGTVASEEVRIEITKPAGVDLEAFNYFKGCPRCDEKTLLEKFPASTYAGYVLLGHGPGGSLLEASVLTPEKRDLEWHVPTGATLAKQEEWRKAARESYETFIKQAKAFLCVHPDFAEQALLRKELATALFNVDKPDEAWIEVEALAKLEGQWADEAKDCLKARASKKSQ